jgi:hypothetical protein
MGNPPPNPATSDLILTRRDESSGIEPDSTQESTPPIDRATSSGAESSENIRSDSTQLSEIKSDLIQMVGLLNSEIDSSPAESISPSNLAIPEADDYRREGRINPLNQHLAANRSLNTGGCGVIIEPLNAEELAANEEIDVCLTPRKADSIPEPLICPPAPRKRISKRRFDCADLIPVDQGISDRIIKKRPIAGSFFTDPPDLDSFPKCIKALFKP